MTNSKWLYIEYFPVTKLRNFLFSEVSYKKNPFSDCIKLGIKSYFQEKWFNKAYEYLQKKW